MTECPNGDLRDLLPDYVNDRLDAGRRADVEAHLSSCEECRAELALLRDLRGTMRRGPVVTVHAIAAAIPPYRAAGPSRWGSGWRVAAAIVAVTVGGTSVALLRSSDVSPARTPAGEVAQRTDAGPGRPSPSAIEPAATVPAPRETPVDGGELAMAGGAIGDLSDRELTALVEGLESLDALPSTEVEGAEPASSNAQEESP